MKQEDSFEQLFFGKENVPLQQLKKTYPYFFPEATPDSIWHTKRKDSLQLALYQATQSLKSDDLRQRITAVLQHVKYYFPDTPLPKKAITLLTDVDYSLRAVDADSLMLLSIDNIPSRDEENLVVLKFSFSSILLYKFPIIKLCDINNCFFQYYF